MCWGSPQKRVRTMSINPLLISSRGGRTNWAKGDPGQRIYQHPEEIINLIKWTTTEKSSLDNIEVENNIL